MNKVSWLVKASAVATLAAVVALASVAGGSSVNAVAQTPAATAKAVEVKIDTLCLPPPSPTPVPATPAAATMAATTAPAAATMAATTAPAAATMAATTAATKAPPTVRPSATARPPTATPIVKGKTPAWAGVTLNRTSRFLRAGKGCINVLGVDAGGPAAAAGILVGDLILGADKVVVKELPDLYLVVADKKSGDVIEVTYQRAGKAVKTKVTLGVNPTVVELTPAK